MQCGKDGKPTEFCSCTATQGEMLSFGKDKTGEPPSYWHMELAMQGLSCIATLATFVRVLQEEALSSVFLALPFLLMLACGARWLTTIREDPSTISTINGAVTGIITGFLCSIVSRDGEYVTRDPIYIESSLMVALRHLELLHIPVAIGSVAYSFCLVFERIPSWRKVYMTTMMAMCVAVLVTVGSDMFGSMETNTDYMKIFLFVFINFFLLGLLPVAQLYQQPWILCMTCMLLNVYWQAGHFDCLVWDYRMPRFPVPGCVTGLVLVFLIFSPVNSGSRTKADDHNEDKRDDLDWLLNTTLWHIITYVIERLSLTFILWKSTSPDATAFTMTTEAPLSCILIVAYLGLVSPHFPASPLMKVTITALGVMFYISCTITNQTLLNGYFLDTTWGLAMFYATHLSPVIQVPRHATD